MIRRSLFLSILLCSALRSAAFCAVVVVPQGGAATGGVVPIAVPVAGFTQPTDFSLPLLPGIISQQSILPTERLSSRDEISAEIVKRQASFARKSSDSEGVSIPVHVVGSHKKNADPRSKKHLVSALERISKTMAEGGKGSVEASVYEAARMYEQALAEQDPDVAQRCIADERMSRLLERDPAAAAGILEKAYALRDLGVFMDGASKRELLTGLLQRFGEDSLLRGLGMDFKEETVLGWVARYRPHRLKAVRFAIKTWDELSPEQKRWFSEDGQRESSWKTLPIDARNLEGWAHSEAKKWKSEPIPKTLEQWAGYRTRYRRIFEMQPYSENVALSKHLRAARAVLRARLALEHAGSGKQGAAFAGILAGLEQMSKEAPSKQLAYLAQALSGVPDEALPRKVFESVAMERAPRPEERLWRNIRHDLARGLKAALWRELAGTAEGERVLRFYAHRGLDLEIDYLAGALAEFRPMNKNIVLDSDMIERWIRLKGLTAQALLKDDKTLRSLARYLAPFFVHEAAHHRQSVFMELRGLADEYPQEQEIDAVFCEALFILEKSERDPSFEDAIPAFEHNLSVQMRRSPREAAAWVRDRYSEEYSLDEELAGNLASMKGLSAERGHESLRGAQSLKEVLEDTGDVRFYKLKPKLSSLSEGERDFWKTYILYWHKRMSSWAASSYAHAVRVVEDIRRRTP
ncbi:MAG: hypothetical protein WCU88_01870 [Elusimicrobiota bacterium]